jgi:hypothetical protein
MHRLLIILIVSALLSSCATVRETYAPDGRKAYSLNCSGTARGWDKCYSAAGELCRDAGYDILDRSSEDVSFASVSGNANKTNASVSGSSVKTNERSMVIVCKK